MEKCWTEEKVRGNEVLTNQGGLLERLIHGGVWWRNRNWPEEFGGEGQDETQEKKDIPGRRRQIGREHGQDYIGRKGWVSRRVGQAGEIDGLFAKPRNPDVAQKA